MTGSYADLTKPFTYTITFYDFNNNPLAVGTEFDYTGGTISGSGATSPASGKLILDNSGSADVSLSNGQSITIAGVPVSGKIQIVQTSADGYTTKYVDSIDPSTDVSSNDTTVKNMTSDDRTFAFNNTRTDVVPAGVFTGSAGSGLFIISALLLGCAACFTVWRFRRRTGDN